jgi:predicted Zn-dependent protease
MPHLAMKRKATIVPNANQVASGARSSATYYGLRPTCHPFTRHPEAAQARFELGNCIEATEELEQIAPEMRGHPSVLEVPFHIFVAANKWEYAAEIAKAISEFAPDNSFGFIHQAYSLHELKRTREAWNVLLPAVDKFPKECIIRYNLACYACQLGNLKAARHWLKMASDLGGTKQIKLMVPKDTDLEPLWKVMGEI